MRWYQESILLVGSGAHYRACASGKQIDDTSDGLHTLAVTSAQHRITILVKEPNTGHQPSISKSQLKKGLIHTRAYT